MNPLKRVGIWANHVLGWLPEEGAGSASTSPAIRLRENVGFIGTHISLLAGAIGMLFLQRYIWLSRIAQQGYGPYQTASYLATLSVVWVVIDLLLLRWVLKGSGTDRIVSLLWPGLFFFTAFYVLVGNNL